MTLKVKNMTCNHCVKTIMMALMKEKIVAKVDLETQTVTVDDSVSKEDVKRILLSAGYDAQ